MNGYDESRFFFHFSDRIAKGHRSDGLPHKLLLDLLRIVLDEFAIEAGFASTSSILSRSSFNDWSSRSLPDFESDSTLGSNSAKDIVLP